MRRLFRAPVSAAASPSSVSLRTLKSLAPSASFFFDDSRVHLHRLRHSSSSLPSPPSSTAVRPGNVIERKEVFVEEKSFTCMCTIEDEVALIDTDTYEQVGVKKDLFGKNTAYLKEEMKITLRLFDDKPLSGSVPKHLICTVKKTSPRLKGVSVTPAYAQPLPFTPYLPNYQFLMH